MLGYHTPCFGLYLYVPPCTSGHDPENLSFSEKQGVCPQNEAVCTGAAISLYEYNDLSQDSDQMYKEVYSCMYWYIVVYRSIIP